MFLPAVLCLTILVFGVIISVMTSVIQSRHQEKMDGISLKTCVLILLGALVGGAFFTVLLDNRINRPDPEHATKSAEIDREISQQSGDGGWGPASRETYSYESPAPSPAINSMLDTKYGDERNFLKLRNVSAGDSQYLDSIEGCAGDEIEVMVRISNAASPSLGTDGDLQGVRLGAWLESEKGSETHVRAYISASNAATVWDSAATSCAGQPTDLIFVESSGRAYWNSSIVSDLADGDPFKNPIPLGIPEDPGTVPADGQWNGLYMFRLRVSSNTFSLI